MKKLLTVLSALVLFGVTGCGEDNTTTTRADTNTSQPPTPQPSGSITQPTQALSGPGSSDYQHSEIIESSGGTGADAWFVFEPSKPKPASAPLVVITHGYFEFIGYASMHELIMHTVKKGNIVIYTRWQTTPVTPCPGPFNIEPCVQSNVNGIKGGIAHLMTDPRRVQPELDKTSYFGFSFGGIVTTNMLNRWSQLGVPMPRAIFLDDPHDGGYAGFGEPALDDDLSGIPASTLFQCHSSENGVTSETTNVDFGAALGLRPAEIVGSKALGSCNALFPKLQHIPAANKDLVMIFADDHGRPALESPHGVCMSPPGEADAYDFNFCWKTFDAMRSCAIEGKDCRFALGNTAEHRSNGFWSDGTPIKFLKIQDNAPVLP